MIKKVLVISWIKKIFTTWLCLYKNIFGINGKRFHEISKVGLGYRSLAVCVLSIHKTLASIPSTTNWTMVNPLPFLVSQGIKTRVLHMLLLSYIPKPKIHTFLEKNSVIFNNTYEVVKTSPLIPKPLSLLKRNPIPNSSYSLLNPSTLRPW